MEEANEALRHILIKKELGAPVITERYITTFFGAKIEKYSSTDVAFVWEQSANEEYLKSKIYITALIDTNDFVGGKIKEPRLGDVAFTVTSIRNPVDLISDDEYWEALKRVIKDVRGKLGNPSMTITKQGAELFYFIEL